MERARFVRKEWIIVAIAVAVLLLGWRAASRDAGDRGAAPSDVAEQADAAARRTVTLPVSEPTSADALELEVPARDAAATVLVEGLVLDSLGGPIEGAQIAARQRAERDALPVALARSDEHGRFSLWLTAAPIREHAQMLWLNARAEGYAEATVAVRAPTRAARLELFAESTLAGVVESESGEPVPGVAVELGPPPLSLLPSWPRAVTDARGRFEFRGLAPGRYRPFVDDGRWFGKLERIELGLVEHRDDLRIVVSAGHRVDVDVRAPDGSPCLHPHARIEGLERDANERDEHGLVTLAAVPSGTHRIIASCRDALSVEQELEITADASLQMITAEGLSIRGRTLDEFGEPVVGASVRAERADSGRAHTGNATESDERGEFELRGLAPGKLIITAARTDRVSGPALELELLTDDPPPLIELRLARGQCVSGDVEGGPAELMVIAGSGKRSLTSLRLSEARRFELCGFEDEGLLWLEDGGTRTRIPFVHDANEIDQLELRFPAASERPLALHVDAAPDRPLRIHVAADGAAVEEALVRIVPKPGPAGELRCGRPFPIEVVRHGVTDEGELTLDGLWAGRYYVHAEADGAQGCAVVSLDERSSAITIELAR